MSKNSSVRRLLMVPGALLLGCPPEDAAKLDGQAVDAAYREGEGNMGTARAGSDPNRVALSECGPSVYVAPSRIFVVDLQSGLLYPGVSGELIDIALNGFVSAQGVGEPDNSIPENPWLGLLADTENAVSGPLPEFSWFELQGENDQAWLVGATLLPNGFRLTDGASASVRLRFWEDGPYPLELMVSVSEEGQPVFLHFDGAATERSDIQVGLENLNFGEFKFSRGLPVCERLDECFSYPSHALRISGYDNRSFELSPNTAENIDGYWVDHGVTYSTRSLEGNSVGSCSDRDQNLSLFRIGLAAASD